MDTTMTQTLTWTKRTVTVQAGEYSASDRPATQWVSADGRFTITPCGRMIQKRLHGFHGQVTRRWSWTGFNLQDAKPVPSYRRAYGRLATVKAAKRAAERVIKSELSEA